MQGNENESGRSRERLVKQQVARLLGDAATMRRVAGLLNLQQESVVLQSAVEVELFAAALETSLQDSTCVPSRSENLANTPAFQG